MHTEPASHNLRRQIAVSPQNTPPGRDGLYCGKDSNTPNPLPALGLRHKRNARTPMHKRTQPGTAAPGWPPKPKRLFRQSRSWIFSPLWTPKGHHI